MRDREASGVLVLVVLTLFVSTIMVWAYVVGSYVSNKRSQLVVPVVTWRV